MKRPIVAMLIGLALGAAACDSASAVRGAAPGSGTSPVHALELIGLVVAGATLALICGAVMRAAVAHHALSRELQRSARQIVIADRGVGLVPGSRIALVAGLRHPNTYLSEDVVGILTESELAAVLAHERAHELRRGPMTLIGLAGVEQILGRVPPVARRLAGMRARLEIDADGQALAAGSSRRSIASAILKLARPTIRGTAPGFGSVADLRLRALVDAERPPARRTTDDFVLALGAALVAFIMCAALVP